MMPLAANAVIKSCKNSDAKKYVVNQSNGDYICVHKTKYYYKDNKCASGYQLVGTKCKKYESAVKKCKVGQKLCSNSYCVGSLKTCKTKNKKGNPSLTCTGSGWRSEGSRCAKTKEASDTKCPVGWFKTNYKPSSNISNKFYCKTNR